MLTGRKGHGWGAVDVGGTKVLAAVAAASAALDERAVRKRPTPHDDGVGTIVQLLREAGGGQLNAVGVAVPGPLNRAAGTLLQPPNLSRNWWHLDLRSLLSEELQCPVVVENDANCGALAEARFGAGRGARRVCYVTVSTGIGSGLVENGVLVSADSEGGHQVVWPRWLGGPECLCGAYGCLETVASGTAIRRRFGVPAEHLDDQAAWNDVGRWLGIGLANLAALQSPDVIVLGGGVTQSADRFWDAMCASLHEHCTLLSTPRVKRAELGPHRNLFGALSLLSTA